MPSIISASRRTDIPAFYGDWFRARLHDGSCDVRNPFSNQIYRISLRREDVLAWVFWSRNYTPFLDTLRTLHAEDQRFLCQFTINGLPRFLEPRTPSVSTALDAARHIADAYTPDVLSWRYDPIILTSATPPDWHLEHFARLASKLRGAAKRCTFSFPCMYKKTLRNLETAAQKERARIWSMAAGDFSSQDLKALTASLAAIAGEHGISFSSCCNEEWVDPAIPIHPAHCVDWPLLRSLLPNGSDEKISHNPTRPGCGCYKSIDIGRYDTCTHGCAYCYAVAHPEKALANMRQHDSENALL